MSERRQAQSSILIIGAGPGVSASVARRYSREGYAIGLVGLDGAALSVLADELMALGTRVEVALVDIRDAVALTDAVRRLGTSLECVHVLHFNPSVFRERSPLVLTAAELAEDVTVGVGALLTALQGARPFMAVGARVTATGSMAADSPWSQAASLGVQKAGLRNLVHSIDAELRSDGIRAVSVTVRGALAPAGEFAPDSVANALFVAATRLESDWTSEVTHG